MASLIHGFESDIFISYRQKDNKHDGWVTDFVGNLNGELESTFKEEISVYFDINPHDGLLETHDVNASLKDKLKCLVFIPIISRTYCDPESFAWEHEFKAFVDMASRDQFGLKIKLPNGNVASRVLPIRIYDLDFEDVKLCESVLGGPIRGIDFVYKEPGINRPLTYEDDERKNLENTRYRNQINKTGNAIKEIIAGLRPFPSHISKEDVRYKEAWEEKTMPKQKEKTTSGISGKRSVKKLLSYFLPALIITGAFVLYILTNQNSTGKTIAILFSTDITNDTSMKYIGDIYAETIHNKIKAIKRIAVRPRINMLQYRESEKPLSEIRKEISVDYLLYGNIKRNRNVINIWIELIYEKADKELWSNGYSWDKSLISKNSAEIVRNLAGYLHTGLSTEELNLIETDPSKNVEANLNYTFANAMSYNAWSCYAMGNKLLESISFTSAINSYDKAIENDSMFAAAYAKRAITRSWGYYTGQLDSTHIKKCWSDIQKALEINNDLPDIQNALGFYYYYCKGEFDKALKHFDIAAKKNPQDYQPLFYMAMVYRRMGEWSNSQNLIKKVINLDPQEALYLTNIGISYTFLHNYDSASIFYQKAIEIMPSWPDAYNNLIENAILNNGNIKEARRILNIAIVNTKDHFSEIKIELSLYEKKYAEALQEVERSQFNDFRYKGDKYLLMAMINRYLSNETKASLCFDSALVSYIRDLSIDSNNPLLHSSAGIAYAGKGTTDKAVLETYKTHDLFKDNIRNDSREIINLAQIYTLIGEYDKAFSSLEYLLKTPSLFSVKLLQLDPVWEPLKDLPEFHRLIAKYSFN
jgi:tetratricopeptide (TPR) repeat protein